MIKYILLSILICTGGCAMAYGHPTDTEIVNAIYKAEGGDSTRHPYGIVSKHCATKIGCREICLHTIQHRRIAWKNNVKIRKEFNWDFIAYIGSIYAPIGAGNDPTHLNENWIANVKYWIKRG